MRHFAVYHNPDAMGYSAEDVHELCFLTNKSVENLIGNRVWLITGEGKPRKYFLRGTFIVGSVAANRDEGFRHIVRGTEGKLFRRRVPVGALPWFDRFKRSQGHFAFGLQRISDEAVIAELKAIGSVAE
jgi:hypothetical protein